MTRLQETAPAKVNLTLKIIGRRTDGYHELSSLVAFANVGDVVSLQEANSISLQVKGPFADRLSRENLVLEAAGAVSRRWPEAKTGIFCLTKNLPVAAGIGGGSADAAAALRLLDRANPGCFAEQDMVEVARGLGADVPVCLASRASMMRGTGEIIEPVRPLPDCAAILVNPGVASPTSDVFARLDASPVAGTGRHAVRQSFHTLDELIDFMATTGNDLEPFAVKLTPSIAAVKSRIAASGGCLVTGLSGSGATCYGLFATEAEAEAAAVAISEEKPDWWAVATTLS